MAGLISKLLGNLSPDDVLYLSKRALDGDSGALKALKNAEGLDEAAVLRRAANRVNKADAPSYTPAPDAPIDTSYRGSHTPPDADYGAPLHDLTDMIPEDVYGPQGSRLYGYGDPAVDKEVFDTLRKARGNPDLEVPIYRAVPKGVTDINKGDWVTTSKEYARLHGENALNGKYDILESVAPAKKLQSEGYPYEFGLLPALGAVAIGLTGSNDAQAAIPEGALPMAVQAAGQSSMEAQPDYGRDFGTIAGLIDMLLPLVAESVKPAMLGKAELTDEQRRRGYYNQGVR